MSENERLLTKEEMTKALKHQPYAPYLERETLLCLAQDAKTLKAVGEQMALMWANLPQNQSDPYKEINQFDEMLKRITDSLLRGEFPNKDGG